MPVCFVPRSTLISAGFTASMTPVTLSPVFKVLKDCSRSSSKLHSSLRFSAIRFFTSCIMPGGVEAPAAIAIVLQTEKRRSSSSESWHASSMCRTVGQTAAASAYSFCVLELCAPPTTSMPSLVCASRTTSFCRSSVTLHIVSKIFAFVYRFLKNSQNFFHSPTSKVVCATAIAGASAARRAGRTSAASAAEPQIYARSPAKLRMPTTSGCVSSPRMTTAVSGPAEETISWIFRT